MSWRFINVSIAKNTITGSVASITVTGDQVSVQGNTISGFNANGITSIGISFSCLFPSVATITGNTFQGTTIALNGIPNGQSFSGGSFHDVQQIQQPCSN